MICQQRSVIWVMRHGVKIVILVVELPLALKRESGKRIIINEIILRGGDDGGNIDG